MPADEHLQPTGNAVSTDALGYYLPVIGLDHVSARNAEAAALIECLKQSLELVRLQRDVGVEHADEVIIRAVKLLDTNGTACTLEAKSAGCAAESRLTSVIHLTPAIHRLTRAAIPSKDPSSTITQRKWRQILSDDGQYRFGNAHSLVACQCHQHESRACRHEVPPTQHSLSSSTALAVAAH